MKIETFGDQLRFFLTGPMRKPCDSLFRPLLAGCIAVLWTGCAGLDRYSEVTKRPNILFAVADDQSWPHASSLGCQFVNTPAFDRVAQEGVQFTHSFCSSPSCTPSRSAILTGRHIWQIEQGGVLYGNLPKKYPLFTHRLEDVGYHVGYTGKGWGPGDWKKGGMTRRPIGREYNGRELAKPFSTGIDTRDYAANFEDFLGDRPEHAPFFFWFGATEPHRVYQEGSGAAAGKTIADVSVPGYWPNEERVQSDILDYAAEIDWFDSQLGRMLALLEEMGELDNTLVVVTSDNGMPFPRAKVNLYDAGVRMPLAMRWGNEIPENRVVDDFTGHIDFAPTFLEAAGLKPTKEMSGKSLLALMRSNASGQIDATRDHVYTALERHTWCRPEGATYPIRGLRTRDFLYLRNFEPDRWPTGGPSFISSNKTFHGDVDECPTKTFMLRDDMRNRYPKEFALSFGKRPAEELYDIRTDPDQIHNVAGKPEYQSVRKTLRLQMEQTLRTTDDPRIRGDDPWQGYVYNQTIGFGATFNRSLSESERAEARDRDSHKPE